MQAGIKHTVHQLWQALTARCQQVKKESHAHLEEAGESYGKHFCFTISMGTNLVITGIVVIIHGLIPSIFTRTASRRVERMYGVMKSRIPVDRLKELDAEWHI